MSDPEYCYPPSFEVLKNKLDIRDRHQLDYFEREFVAQRIAEGIPTVDFDLSHLMAIHRHIFQDIYEWAGELRTVEIAKDGHQFQFRRFIRTGMEDVHRRLVGSNLLRDLAPGEFSHLAAKAIGDINYVHPFREGNGRTQLLYLQQLAYQAGHYLNLLRINRESWMEASRRSHHGDYDPMRDCIAEAITLTPPE